MAGAAAIIVGSIAAATGLAGMGIGLGQSAKQRRAASQAEADSKRLMQEARNRMMKDEFENIQLPTESYDRAFRSNVAQQRQALDSLQGADARTLAAGVGKVGALGVAATEEQRLEMAKDLYALELKKAENRNRIQDELVGMDVGQARDMTTKAGDLNQASAASSLSAIQSGIAGVSALASSLPDYMKSGADRKAGTLAESGVVSGMEGKTVQTDAAGKPLYRTDLPDDYNLKLKPGEEGYMDPYQYRDLTQNEIQTRIRDNFDSIFDDDKSYRKLKRNDFKDLTPAQLAKIKEILGVQ